LNRRVSFPKHSRTKRGPGPQGLKLDKGKRTEGKRNYIQKRWGGWTQVQVLEENRAE